MMRVVFMGTPAFAAKVLEALIESKHEVAGVVTRPDAVRGRGKKLVSSAVKDVAVAHSITVLEHSSLRSDEAHDAIAALEPDVICVAAYGALLPARILELPRFGCLNVHGSLLPRWRGAAPVERAILAGDELTGIGIMNMEEGLDTGATAKVVPVEIGTKTATELSLELAQVGGRALVEVLDELDAQGSVHWTDQAEDGVTYANKIEKGELNIVPEDAAAANLRRIQASSENHSARGVIAGKTCTILRAQAGTPSASLGAGQVAFEAKRLYLGCADGAFEVLDVKPDGKKAMEARAFAAGIQGIKKGGITWSALND